MPSIISDSERDAIEGLHQAGAHFVMVRGKIPVWKGYLGRRPGLSTLGWYLDSGHDAHLGIVPASIGSTVLDVDAGNQQQMTRVIGDPRVALDSRSRKGAHLYYDDTTSRGNGQFRMAGCSGDIRSGKGFVVMYQGQHCRLYEALSKEGRYPIQESIFKEGTPPARRQVNTKPKGERVILPENVSERDLTQCQEGQRNQMLFDVGRKQIYPLGVFRDLGDWVRRCRVIIGELNRLIPVPTDRNDVHKIADSIATWTYDRFEHLEYGRHDHSFAAQFRRGIKRHYGDARQWRQYMIRARNGRICDLYGIGWTQARIAADVGLSQQMIGKILAKSVMYGKAPKRQTITEAAPWDREGISRRTWYYRQAEKPWIAQNTTA